MGTVEYGFPMIGGLMPVSRKEKSIDDISDRIFDKIFKEYEAFNFIILLINFFIY